MSQQDQHLTTEQLSALLDQQLSPEEQAACNAHLVDCEQCQYALDNLQLTVNLLQSLPVLEVPRSFALPTDFKIASDANPYVDNNWMDYETETRVDENEHAATKKKSSPRRLSTPFRQTLRTISALAAAVGLFLALSGFITTLSQLHMGGSMGSSASTTNAPALSGVNKPTSPVAVGPQSKAQGLPNGASTNEGSSNTTTTQGASNQSATPVHQPSNPHSTNKQPPPATATTSSTVTWLPLIDFNQPGIRLSIGILLAMLGWMGYRLFTRQQR